MSHDYFAYGSNLCLTQMAQRCPDARDARPARLPGHDWLINERGVATVEASPDGEVHGVLWRVSDRDLATLDSAEGVPVRYRRARLTVHVGEHAHQAWVYVDPRVEPGAPRPGYLERIVAGAALHGLPQCWIDSLRRWDPSTWRGPATPQTPAPQTLTELLADPAVVEDATLRSTFGFLAIHGGGLERMTDVIAERAADAADASCYVLRHPADYPHHLASARFRAEESELLAGFLRHVDVVVSLHGYGRNGRSTHLLAGGGNRRLAGHLAARLDLPGYRVVTELDDIPRELRGLHPRNPVNQPRGGGAQLELPARVRGISPRSPLPGDDGLSSVTSALIGGLAAAARSWR